MKNKTTGIIDSLEKMYFDFNFSFSLFKFFVLLKIKFVFAP